MELSIVVPVYHEQDLILKTIAEIDKKVSTPHELVIVYDTPDDPTFGVVEGFIHANRRKDIRLVRNNIGSGRGALNALKTGLKEALAPAILVTMADLSDDPIEIDKMYDEYKRGAKVVCGSRYMKGGKQIGGPRHKSLMTRAAGLSLYYLRRLPVHDATNNFRLYDKEMLETIVIESTGGFELAMELTVKAHKNGYKVTEVPVTWRDRTEGESNFKLWKWLPLYLKWYFYALF